MQLLKVSVLGNGSIGRRHLRGLSAVSKQLGVTEIRGFDTNPDRRELVKAETPNVVSVDNIKAAVSGVDTVFMCVPTSLHVPIYEQIRDLGQFDLFIEKPLSHTLQGCEQMLFEQKKIGKKVAVGYMMHYHPVLQRAKSLIESGKLGRVLSVRAEGGFYLPSWHPWENYQDFYMSWKTGGGGALLDISHEIDYLQWLFGEVEEVQGFMGTISDLEISSDDMAAAILKFKNGVIGQFQLDLLQFDESRYCKVIGTDGVLRFDFAKSKVIYNTKDSTDWEEENINVNIDDIYAEEYKSVLSAFRGEDVHYVSGEQSYNTMQVIEAVRRSHSYGVRVKMPLYN